MKLHSASKYSYKYFRSQGFSALEAHRAFKTCRDFDELDLELTCQNENENYFSVYGEPEGYTTTSGKRISPEQERADICGHIGLYGLWHVSTSDGSDSVGVVLGPLGPENPCVLDIMEAEVSLAIAEREAFTDEVNRLSELLLKHGHNFVFTLEGDSVYLATWEQSLKGLRSGLLAKGSRDELLAACKDYIISTL